MKWLRKFWNCTLWGAHEWTTPFLERGNIVDQQLMAEIGVMETWAHDNLMYCKHCEHISEPTRRMYKKDWNVIIPKDAKARDYVIIPKIK